MVLLGLAGAFRLSELVGLNVEDCSLGKDGLTVTLRRSKTDQEGIGRRVGIPYGSNPETCPMRTLQAWLEQAAIRTGPLFRSLNRHGHLQPGRFCPVDVARMVKKLALRAGLDAAKYAGRSLRAGHATSAAIAGASERSIMNQTGHRSVQMVRRYIRERSLFRENSAGSWAFASSRRFAMRLIRGLFDGRSRHFTYACRRMTQAYGKKVTIPLPNVRTGGGLAAGECTTPCNGYSWFSRGRL